MAEDHPVDPCVKRPLATTKDRFAPALIAAHALIPLLGQRVGIPAPPSPATRAHSKRPHDQVGYLVRLSLEARGGRRAGWRPHEVGGDAWASAPGPGLHAIGYGTLQAALGETLDAALEKTFHPSIAHGLPEGARAEVLLVGDNIILSAWLPNSSRALPRWQHIPLTEHAQRFRICLWTAEGWPGAIRPNRWNETYATGPGARLATLLATAPCHLPADALVVVPKPADSPLSFGRRHPPAASAQESLDELAAFDCAFPTAAKPLRAACYDLAHQGGGGGETLLLLRSQEVIALIAGRSLGGRGPLVLAATRRNPPLDPPKTAPPEEWRTVAEAGEALP